MLEKDSKVFRKGCRTKANRTRADAHPKKVEPALVARQEHGIEAEAHRRIQLPQAGAHLTRCADIKKFRRVTPPKHIVDGVVSTWIPEECSVPCDDKCLSKKGWYANGCMQTLVLEVKEMDFEGKCLSTATYICVP